MSDDDEASSTDDDFLAYLLDDDDDDYDDDVALFLLVRAYISELSRKSCVQRHPSFYVRDRLEWETHVAHLAEEGPQAFLHFLLDFNHRLSRNCAVFLIFIRSW
jgi:hypothetical protein